MPRFHLSKTGQAAECNATVKACPLGEAPHGEFMDQASANQWAEQKLAEEFGGSFTPPSGTAVKAIQTLVEWEEEINGLYPIDGYVLENPFRQWDIDQMEAALPFVDTSAKAQEVVDLLVQKSNEGDEYWPPENDEEAQAQAKLKALVAQYNSTPDRQEEISAQERAREEGARAAREQQAQRDKEEEERREALGPAGRWEEDYESYLDYSAPALFGEPMEALAGAIEVAHESPKARQLIKNFRYTVRHEAEGYDEHQVEAAKALLALYDATPARQVEIARANLLKAERNLNFAMLSSNKPEEVRSSYEKLSQNPRNNTADYIAENPSAPADVVRSVAGRVLGGEAFLSLYDHPSKPFATESVSAVSSDPALIAFDTYAKKIDSDTFSKEDLERVKTEFGEEWHDEPALRDSLFARLRARLRPEG